MTPCFQISVLTYSDAALLSSAPSQLEGHDEGRSAYMNYFLRLEERTNRPSGPVLPLAHEWRSGSGGPT